MKQMIKANELRIGNKLQKENGEAYTVSRIDNTQDVLVEEQRGLLTLNYNLFGITLTPEILKKFGFVYWELDIDCTDPKDAYWVHPKMKFAINNLYWTVQKIGKRVKYLHQLQNLYFALTGEELIYKNEN